MINHFIGEGITYNEELCTGLVELIFRDFGKELIELSIIQITDLELLEVNREFLKHDYLTDIITFNYDASDGVDGELYISYERIVENARTTISEELYRVIIHGCLHLCGLGDRTEDEIRAMRDGENKYLEICSTWNERCKN